MHVPQHWFNAFTDFDTDENLPPEWNWVWQNHREGDLLVHFPGTNGDSRADYMNSWLDLIKEEPTKFAVDFNSTKYPAEISYFWENDAVHENKTQIAYWKHWNQVINFGDEKGRAESEAKEKLFGKYEAEGKAQVVAKYKDRIQAEYEAEEAHIQITLEEEKEDEILLKEELEQVMKAAVDEVIAKWKAETKAEAKAER